MRIEVLFLGGQWTRELLMTMMMVMSEDQSQAHVTEISGYWGFSGEEPVLNRLPGASMWEGGSILNTSHMIGNWQSTQHSRWVIRPTRRAATNSIFYSKFAVQYTILYNNYFGTGKDNMNQERFPAIHSCLYKGKLSNLSQINIFKSCMSMLFQQLTLPETNTFKFLIN